MATGTDFIWFAANSGSNVQGQSDYANSTSSGIAGNGFTSGVVLSGPFNKVLRQGSAGAASLGLFCYDATGTYIYDDGNTLGFANAIRDAVTKVAQNAGAGGGVTSFNSRAGTVTLSTADVTSALGFTPARSGPNADITALSGLTTPLSSFQGGTGRTDGTVGKWTTPRTISFTGDATGSFVLDGSANAGGPLTLAATGVAAGNYLVSAVTTDAKGRITAVRSLTKVVLTSGTSWTPPPGVTAVYAEVDGDGGGGAGATSVKSGGGGGSGGFAAGVVSVTPGSPVSYNVGPGGAAGASGQDGSAGAGSSFAGLSATGGGGGVVNASVAGGSPGVGSGGALNMSGGCGTDGNLQSIYQAGNGGSSRWGGGGRGGQGGGVPGAAPGSGGGGAYGGTGAGGQGAAGQITLTF